MVPKVRSPTKMKSSLARSFQGRSVVNDRNNKRSYSPSKKQRNKIHISVYLGIIALILAIRSFGRFDPLSQDGAKSDEIGNKQTSSFIEIKKSKNVVVASDINSSKSDYTIGKDEKKNENQKNATNTTVDEKKKQPDVIPMPIAESLFNESSILKQNDTKKKNPKPDLAWLMSFPNSGTSFTLRVVRRASKRTTGTNYGREKMYSGSSVPYHPSVKNGPFVHVLHFEVPEKFILTKTHCGGFCSTCAPDSYLLSEDEFKEWCLSGKSLSENEEFKEISYDIKMVKKVLYLIRNPFDNIVSRFHLIHNEQVRLGKEGDENAKKWLEKHPRDIKGFHEWCSESEKFDVEELTYFPEAASFPSVICRSEFIKYIQWHNHASKIVKSHKIPLLTIHYEDYDSKYDESIDSILNFLELEKIGNLKDFKLSDYSEYYTEEQKKQSIELMKKMASDKTLKNIKRYFNSNTPADKVPSTKHLRT